MRILQVIDSLAVAGAERIVVLLARGLEARGHEVHVAVSERGGGLESSLAGGGVHVHHVPHHLPLGIDGMASVARLIRELSPDVVHSHLLGSDIIGRAAALWSRVPVIVSTQHDVALRGLRYDAYRSVTSWLIDVTVACSAEVEAHCLRHLRVPRNRLVRIDNGIDMPAPAPRRETPVDAPRTVVSVAGLKPIKRHDLLLRAFDRVRRNHPKVRLVLVGEGAERLRLETLVRDLALHDEVQFAGEVASPAESLANADLFVSASDSEGFGLSVIEAMAAQLPVVVTAVGPLPEIVEGGRAGILVPPGDVIALAEAIDRVLGALGSPEIRSMVRRGAERVTSLYSAERMVDQYEALYVEIRRGDRGTRPRAKRRKT